MSNIDSKTVAGFGDEWERFDQSGMSSQERDEIFNWYFGIFPWDQLPSDAVGCDVGCGSGRWAQVVAPRVGHLHCVDPSSAIEVAKAKLSDRSNVSFHLAGVDELPFADQSLDFAYSLGVLHHIPDTRAAMMACVKKLKPGAPFLVYLYYAFDNRPAWFRGLWKASDIIRRRIAVQPHGRRYHMSQILAALVYWPLARAAALAEKLGVNVSNWPLSAYRDRSYYTIRTDALDRFGTRLEQRFTRAEIEAMMQATGLENICFSETIPYWCAVGTRKAAA
jgi:ubiquinone/menaquinone biosynthesis C-methylase UbiE